MQKKSSKAQWNALKITDSIMICPGLKNPSCKKSNFSFFLLCMPPVAKSFQWHPKSWPGVNSLAFSSFQSHTKQSNVRPKRLFTVQNKNSINTKESTFAPGQRFSHCVNLNPCASFHATIIYSISGTWLQKFAQALSVELRPKNTWSTDTLNTTPAKSPAPRWTLGLSEIGAEGQKVQKSKLVTFFLL